MKNRRILAGIAGLCLISLAVSGIAIASMAAFVQKTENGGGADGDVGLRNYYQKGSGSSEDPFVISRPIHFYNFSRLQSLGVYSDPTQPKFFQLGYDPTGKDDLKFFASDDDLAPEHMVKYLDMSAYDGTTAAKTIHPIGSEAFPFSGRFDGMNLQISNLKVIGDAQDVGVFGYTSSSSVVKNVLFDQLMVVCRGYETNSFGDLFSSNISPNIKIGDNTISTSDSLEITRNGSFEVTFEEPSGGFTTSIEAACEYLAPSSDRKKLTLLPPGAQDAEGQYSSIFDLFDYYAGTYPAEIEDRISIVAHKIVDGISTGRVISVYKAIFRKESAQSNIVLSVTKVDRETHGCNVGFAIGHCDGSLSKVYVHNGTLDINPEVVGYTNLAQKSEYGLIGLIGASVGNSYKGGEDAAGLEGNTVGVVNFSDIYDGIIDGDANFQKVSNGVWTYKPKTENPYMDYLRYRLSTDEVRYSYDQNTVSLRGRSIIRDGGGKDYGLGVFAVVTDTMTEGNGALYYNDKLENCMIEQDPNGLDEVYYTTAEWVNSKVNGQWQNIEENWGGNKAGEKHVHPGYYIPEEYDSDPDYHKNLNFIFRTSLDSSTRYFAGASENDLGGRFLREYFQSKLVDADSNFITAGPACGIEIKDKGRNNIDSFTASLHLANKTNDSSNVLHYMAGTDKEGNPQNLVSRTVNFSVTTNLANVTVIAKKVGDSAKSAKVGVYKLDGITFGNNLLTDRQFNQPDYSMYIPSDSEFAYFDYQSGQVGNHANQSEQFSSSRFANIERTPGITTDKLFAHTFLLPKGDYAIATAEGDCNLYFVCAQGQEEGDYGSTGVLHSRVNSVELIDFIKDEGASFDWDHPEDSRCFVSLNPKDEYLSNFTNGNVALSFSYDEDDEDFYIQAGNASQKANIVRISTLNYAKDKITVHLIDCSPSNEETITYPAS